MKILIFTPIYEGKKYCLTEFVANSKKIIEDCPVPCRHIYIDNSVTSEFYHELVSLGLDAHRVRRGNNSREALARAQNYARKIALDENYDYMFSLECDMFPPKDVIKRLLVSGKTVISGLYLIGDTVKIPCITLSHFYKEAGGLWGTRLLEKKEWTQYMNKGIKPVQAAGMGCCLIHKLAFAIEPFTFDPRFTGHSDIYFFNRMKTNHIKVYVDTDIFCKHKQSDWKKVLDR